MSIIDSIVSFFKKLWDVVRKVLTYILVICAILLILWACFFSGGLLLFGVLSATQAIVIACVALAGAFMIDGDTAGQIVGSVGDGVSEAVTSVGVAIGDVAGAIGGAVGDTVSGLLGGILTSPIGWLMIGVGLYLLLGKGDATESPSAERGNGLEPKPGVADNSSVLGVGSVNNLEVQ